MKIEPTPPSVTSPTKEQAHLAQLRQMVETAMADGKILLAMKIQRPSGPYIHADHKVTVDELFSGEPLTPPFESC